MKDLIDFVSAGSNAAFVLGIVLLLLGLFAPKKFVGIEVDWTPATSGLAVIMGLIFIAFSFPQLQFRNRGKVTAATAIAGVDDIFRAVKHARDNVAGATTNTSDVQGCVDASKAALTFLDDALKLLDAAKPKTP
ncbi:hypothetical protein NLM33_38430 [Bradyrhizobium sp. CCGUVB1N3]|uniref:hypothetical protein n=1 Tax=Bradyrhizobium sp. CCGUVB1N3 TaxID=2949629 RepID=UPI0020B290E3|nr:hypothetical protein [Bradyrhizobium sp. CCGUVB1N3]MCP3476108.1 hypothetical protein [Bradyrhizobium sp. CCGUVB1N3]